MNNLRILLVEDDPGLCLLFKRMLDKLGYDVVDSVPLNYNSMEKIRQLDPDLILVDVVLSETVNSLEIAQKLTSGLGIPGILISNHGLDYLMERDASVVRYQFLRKPFFVSDLAHAISRARVREVPDDTDQRAANPLHGNTPKPERLCECKPHDQGKDKPCGLL